MKNFILLFLLVPFYNFAQVIEVTTDDRNKMEFSGVYKSAISLELGGKSGFAGLSYDLFLTRKLRVGFGAGAFGGGVDFKLYPYGVARDKALLNIGLRANAFLQNNGANHNFYSLPIGLSFFTVNRINLEFDVGPMWKQQWNGTPANDTQIGSKINYVWFSAKIGYRFSFYAMKRARQLNKQEEIEKL